MNREDIRKVRELGFGSDYENLYAALVCFTATNNCAIENISITDMQLQRLMTGRIPATFHIAFEKIHPFLDGNGRVGRLIMLYQLVACGLHAAVIERERAQEYFAALSLPDDETTRTLAEIIRAEAEVFDSAYNIL